MTTKSRDRLAKAGAVAVGLLAAISQPPASASAQAPPTPAAVTPTVRAIAGCYSVTVGPWESIREFSGGLKIP